MAMLDPVRRNSGRARRTAAACATAAALVFTGVPALAEMPGQLPGHAAGQAAGQIKSQAGEIFDTLQIDKVMPIISQETVAQGDELAQSLFGAPSDNGWHGRVQQIAQTERLSAIFRSGLEEGLARMTTADRAALGRAMRFFRAPLGQRLLSVETSARQALLSPDAETAAQAAWDRAADRGDPRCQQILRLITAADLVEPNVAGGLNAAMAFTRGFSAAGGYPEPVSEEQLLADVWQQEPDIRAETQTWAQSYLMLAYGPISDAELDRYIAFSQTSDAKTLTGLMFQAFDVLFVTTSRDMGMAAAGRIAGTDI
ncbi:hypothetical protein [Paracoccus pacificus]|uniref:DUF2059 domain-containing protein n=1 Tax=Paracoccus pacificus TaxID=1463598 RepID=A0ABW4RCE4_9RHOB